MKVSILTPTKDRPGFVERAIASVRAQSYQDWELILYDVGERSILDRVPRDSRIRYRRGVAEGPAADFDWCLRQATGDLVHPLSDDDELPSYALAHAVSEISDHEWLIGSTVLRNEAGDVFAYRGGTREALTATLAGEYMLGGAVYWRKTLSDRVGGFRAEYDGAADFDLYLRFARAAEPRIIPDVLYLYTDHAGTDSRVRAENQQHQSARIRSLA